MNRFHGMVLRQPTHNRWQDALPTGNGPIGAMVYGNIYDENILLNHEDRWLREYSPELPDSGDRLAEMRQLLADGKYEEAEGFIGDLFEKVGYDAKIDSYHPLGDLSLTQHQPGIFSHYRRGLNFATGEAFVTWNVDGVEGDFSRRLFVSRADDVVVLTVDGPAGRINCDLRLVERDKVDSPREIPIQYTEGVDGDFLTLVGTYDRGGQFGAVARVIARGGALQQDQRAYYHNEMLRIADADGALVLIKLFANEPAEAAIDRVKGELAELPDDYEQLLARHLVSHGEMFGRVSLALGPEGEHETNDDLLAEAYEGSVPTALIERMFEFGRFLLMCSSAPGGLPANLQGVWNGSYSPPWSSDFHNDENIQMNYWQALPGGLPEATEPYFDYYELFLDDFRANASKVYGCRGLFIPIAQSTHGRLTSMPYGNWTAGAGWIAQLYWEYWLFTGDRGFLAQRVVPFLKETAEFYEDFLFEGADGTLVFSPSMSPENAPSIPETSMVSINATMDVAIAKEVLTNLCEACELLSVEPEGVERWRGMLAKMPAYEANEDGAIREWLWPGLADNYHHRHQSHIYPLFPGFEVTEESDPQMYEACRVAVEKRLVIGLTSQTGWSLSHMANIYARLGEGDRALECLEILTRSCTACNLLTYHNDWRKQGLTLHWGETFPPFQMDANFGLTAAVIEMLLFSTPKMLKLLPALPSKWSTGQINGLQSRCGVAVDIQWDMEAGTLQANLTSREAQTITIKFPFEPTKVDRDGGEVSASEYGPAYRQIALPAGHTVTIATNK
jgi:alpha-L-fucosidase 2